MEPKYSKPCVKMKENLQKAKSFALTIGFAALILIIAVNVVKISQSNIIGRAYDGPVQIYGTIEPALPDGTIIVFKLNGIEVARDLLKNSTYGYDEKLFLILDDETTVKKEGYTEGDIVGVYIEDIRVIELSYFNIGMNKKDINIPVSLRNEIAAKAALAVIQRGCEPKWQCEEWSECIFNKQTRTCIDVNECRIEYKKPAEERECETKLITEEPLGIREFITPDWVLTVSLFIILTISLIMLIRRAVWEHRIRKHIERKAKRVAAKRKR